MVKRIGMEVSEMIGKETNQDAIKIINFCKWSDDKELNIVSRLT